VGAGYFEAVGIELLAGEGFPVEDQGEMPSTVVVNRAFVERFLAAGDAVGRSIEIDGVTVRVLGVSRDARTLLQDDVPDPVVYLPLGPGPVTARTVIYRSEADPLALAPAVQAAIRSLLPAHPRVVIRTVRDVLSDALVPQRVGAVVVGVMGLVAVLLAALGLYGLVQFTVSRDMRALGVRLALGGARSDVAAAVLRHGFRLAAIGVGVGAAVALALTPALRPFLTGIPSWDPVTYGLVVVGFGLVALAASLAPALRASRIDPVVALRAD
jgi:hypothetical protein